jgi:putative ABC transport system ATP-binding protein
MGARLGCLIAIDGVRKDYTAGGTTVPALCGVSLAVQAGEFVALMGPSGSGKSTLMNLIGLLDRPTAGLYHFEAQDVAALGRRALARLRNQKIGFVFQSFQLLPRLTALENVAVPLLYAGVSGWERKRRARAVLETFGLGDRLGHRPNQLSGGQQQRVAIARALVNRPALILADEPTGNLDSATGAEVLGELTRLHREQGQTIVLVTHDATVAAAAERIVTLRDGRVVGDVSNGRAEGVSPLMLPQASDT